MVRDPVLLSDGPQDPQQPSGGRLQARSCVVNQSCPTCLPCCIAVFVAPVVFLLWTLYPGWQHSREINERQRPVLQQQVQGIQTDAAGQALLEEVQAAQFSSRAEIEHFIGERSIRYEVRANGDWLALDSSQQPALVELHNHWLALPAQD